MTNFSLLKRHFDRWLDIGVIFIIGTVILIAFRPVLDIIPFAEDYVTLDLAERLNVIEYIGFSLEQCITAAFCRPANALGVWIEYRLMGYNPTAYRFIEILVHLLNCLLLYTLVSLGTGKRRIGFLSALMYGALPALGASFFWFNIPDHAAGFFYLSTLLFWFHYLKTEKSRDYALAFGSFVMSAMNKEIGLTLPIALFLLDRWIVGGPACLSLYIRRYWIFAFACLVYGLSLSFRLIAFTQNEYSGAYAGLGVGSNVLSNLVSYLLMMAYPWQVSQPDVPLVLALGLLLPGLVFFKRNLAVAFLGVMAVLPILPVLLLTFTGIRYLYLSLMAVGVLFASVCAQIVNLFPRSRITSSIGALAISILLCFNSATLGNAFEVFATFARQYRLPIRPIFQQYSRFPQGTYLYFVNSPIPTAILSGMFAVRYGSGVFVGGTDNVAPANLHYYAPSYVCYFNEQQQVIVQPVQTPTMFNVEPRLPVVFSTLISLEDIEIASVQLERGDALIGILYWRALAKIDKDYTVFAHLVDSNGEQVASSDSQPRGGKVPTSAWSPENLIVDWIIVPLSDQVPSEQEYQLEIGLYYLPTLERLRVTDESGYVSDKITIRPFSIK